MHPTGLPKTSKGKNRICFVYADDQGWADVGYYPYSEVKTPVLNEMALNGVRFDRFYAGAPNAAPADHPYGPQSAANRH